MSLQLTYTKLEQRLTDCLATNFNVPGLPKLQHTDLFNDQFNEFEEGREWPFMFPAILIDLNDIVWESKGRKTQQGISLIRFHVGQNLLDYKLKSSMALKYLEEVHKAMHGFNSNVFSSLSRIRTQLDSSHGNVIVHTIDYQTAISDRTADPEALLDDINNVDVETKFNSVPPQPSSNSPYHIPGQ